MRHMILLRHSCILADHVVALGTVMQECLSIGLISEDASPSLILPWKHNRFVAVIMIDRYIRFHINDSG